MPKFYPCLLFVLLAAVLASAGGCGGTAPKADEPTPAQYFKEKQANTITPHGKIMTDSVTGKDGKIQYKTEDGKQWRVTYTKRADGAYQYGMPDEIK